MSLKMGVRTKRKPQNKNVSALIKWKHLARNKTLTNVFASPSTQRSEDCYVCVIIQQAVTNWVSSGFREEDLLHILRSLQFGVWKRILETWLAGEDTGHLLVCSWNYVLDLLWNSLVYNKSSNSRKRSFPPCPEEITVLIKCDPRLEPELLDRSFQILQTSTESYFVCVGHSKWFGKLGVVVHTRDLRYLGSRGRRIKRSKLAWAKARDTTWKTKLKAKGLRA
jgi:hypothetical protein